MKFGLFDGGGDGEHNGSGFVAISRRSAMFEAIFFVTREFDGVMHTIERCTFDVRGCCGVRDSNVSCVHHSSNKCSYVEIYAAPVINVLIYSPYVCLQLPANHHI